jgi:hypothetical protein
MISVLVCIYAWLAGITPDGGISEAVVDDDELAIRIPFSFTEDDLFVVGLALDTSAGGQVGRHPPAVTPCATPTVCLSQQCDERRCISSF